MNHLISPRYDKKVSPPPDFSSNAKAKLKYTNNEKFVDIVQVRERLRKNKIDHLNYNPVLDMKEGMKYYKGLYTPNQKTMEPTRATLALAAAVASPAAQEPSRVFTEPDQDLNLPELRAGENLFDFIDARS